MLEVNGIDVFYGNLQVLWNVSFKVTKGLTVIIGPNGSGKTTTVRTIMGLNRPAGGSISFLGKRIDRLPPYRIAELGISLVPEGRKLFTRMNVHENLLMGAYTSRAHEKLHGSLEWVYQLFPILKERSSQFAGTLSGGERQMLAIARSLMARPKLLMLDEPSLGLAPKLVVKAFETIKRLKEEGVTTLLVEQNVYSALELSDWAYVLEEGRVVLEGSGDELLGDEHVKKAYLGR